MTDRAYRVAGHLGKVIKGIYNSHLKSSVSLQDIDNKMGSFPRGGVGSHLCDLVIKFHIPINVFGEIADSY